MTSLRVTCSCAALLLPVACGGPADEAELVTPMVRLFLVGGVLGGFTTFSTFGIETWQLVEDGRAALALTYAAGSLVAGVAGVAIGVAATRSLF